MGSSSKSENGEPTTFEPSKASGPGSGLLHPQIGHGLDLLLDGYYDEAVRWASQRFVNRVQERVGRTDLDGAALMNKAFSAAHPLLEFNDRGSPFKRDEHDGYRFLAVGMVRAVRNVLTHHDHYGLGEIEAVEWLHFISAMHRRLDLADQVSTPALG